MVDKRKSIVLKNPPRELTKRLKVSGGEIPKSEEGTSSKKKKGKV